MKLDFDKEIDSLLRHHPEAARKRGAMADATADAARRDAGETRRAAIAHLDVDELSAYAENALPAATRARYTSHLADCESCRRLAANIAMAADVAGALERSGSPGRTPAENPAVPSGWRAVLASFFKPRAFLYAMPVLALLVTGTMIFMATLTFQRNMMPAASRVATKEAPREDAASYEERAASEETDDRAGQAVMSTPAPAAVNQEAPRESGTIDSPRQTSESKKTEAFARAAKDDAAPADAPAASGVASTSVSQPPAPQTAATATVETRQLQSRTEVESLRADGRGASPLAAASPVKEVARAADKEEAREKKAEDIAVTGGNKVVNAPPARRERSGVARDEFAAAEKQNEKSEAVIVKRPAAPKARPEGETTAKLRRRAPREMSDSPSASSVETRSVAGRQFRRQGGGWVDAEYKSSTSLTNVTRGSEQYRALVADEPELRRIAEQLGGEIIVVWKNRAYRIR